MTGRRRGRSGGAPERALGRRWHGGVPFVWQDELSMERKRDKDDRGLVINMIIVFISAGDGIETKEATHACSLDVVGGRVES
uniref:Uncharacterized protein n=1 Tax=Oryza meridionalis TaxID=40149 RepID=A0A0E0C6I6_9ORYZ